MPWRDRRSGDYLPISSATCLVILGVGRKLRDRQLLAWLRVVPLSAGDRVPSSTAQSLSPFQGHGSSDGAGGAETRASSGSLSKCRRAARLLAPRWLRSVLQASILFLEMLRPQWRRRVDFRLRRGRFEIRGGRGRNCSSHSNFCQGGSAARRSMKCAVKIRFSGTFRYWRPR